MKNERCPINGGRNPAARRGRGNRHRRRRRRRNRSHPRTSSPILSRFPIVCEHAGRMQVCRDTNLSRSHQTQTPNARTTRMLSARSGPIPSYSLTRSTTPDRRPSPCSWHPERSGPVLFLGFFSTQHRSRYFSDDRKTIRSGPVLMFTSTLKVPGVGSAKKRTVQSNNPR